MKNINSVRFKLFESTEMRNRRMKDLLEIVEGDWSDQNFFVTFSSSSNKILCFLESLNLKCKRIYVLVKFNNLSLTLILKRPADFSEKSEVN